MRDRAWVIVTVVGVVAGWSMRDALSGEGTGEKDLAHQVFETMLKGPGVTPGFRLVHAKGIVCRGSFQASTEAAKLSKAADFQGTSVPVTVRFSDGAGDPMIPDGSPKAGPQGMAIRFHLPDGGETDIVANSHNGFVVSNGEEFLALERAIVATDYKGSDELKGTRTFI